MIEAVLFLHGPDGPQPVEFRADAQDELAAVFPARARFRQTLPVVLLLNPFPHDLGQQPVNLVFPGAMAARADQRRRAADETAVLLAPFDDFDVIAGFPCRHDPQSRLFRAYFDAGFSKGAFGRFLSHIHEFPFVGLCVEAGAVEIWGLEVKSSRRRERGPFSAGALAA